MEVLEVIHPTVWKAGTEIHSAVERWRRRRNEKDVDVPMARVYTAIQALYKHRWIISRMRQRRIAKGGSTTEYALTQEGIKGKSQTPARPASGRLVPSAA